MKGFRYHKWNKILCSFFFVYWFWDFALFIKDQTILFHWIHLGDPFSRNSLGGQAEFDLQCGKGTAIFMEGESCALRLCLFSQCFCFMALLEECKNIFYYINFCSAQPFTCFKTWSSTSSYIYICCGSKFTSSKQVIIFKLVYIFFLTGLIINCRLQ